MSSTDDRPPGAPARHGWPLERVDSEDTLIFSQRNKIASMNEVYPLEQAQSAYERKISGKARFRVVLKVPAA